MAIAGMVRTMTNGAPNGRRRKSYARIADVLPIPDLIRTQIESFEWFRTEGIRELFDEI